ncbi:MAG: glycosyltransferase [Bacteroidales bacterium]|nr:glycosyltransferase [Bacteroidales bacterium]
MKRVLLFIDSLGSGGAQRQLVNLARLLNERNYDVKVITYYNFTFFTDFLINNNIKYENFKPTKIKLCRIWLLRKVIREYKPNILLSYLDTPNIIAIIASLYKKNWKLVVSERSTTQILDFRTKLKFHLYKFADIIIVNSKSQLDYLNCYHPYLNHKLVLISNCLDLRLFNILSTGKNHMSTLEIGVLASFYNVKNTINLVHAVGILHSKGYNIKVTWHGDKLLRNGYNSENDNYYLKVYKEIKNIGIENIFLLCDPIKDVISFYHRIDAFCLPSVNEGFSNVIAEAIACGKPILASDIGDIKLMVKNGINGFLFNPHSIASMVNAFEKFCMLTEDKIIQMGKESRIIAKNLLAEEIFIKKYINVIEKI